MRKIIFALMLAVLFAFCLTSCGNEENDSPTTYQIVNNSSKSLYDVIVFCYVGNDPVREDVVSNIYSDGESRIVEVPDNYEKIRVSFKDKYYSDVSRRYTVSYKLLEKGKNTIFELDDNTQIQ